MIADIRSINSHDPFTWWLKQPSSQRGELPEYNFTVCLGPDNELKFVYHDNYSGTQFELRRCGDKVLFFAGDDQVGHVFGSGWSNAQLLAEGKWILAGMIADYYYATGLKGQL